MPEPTVESRRALDADERRELAHWRHHHRLCLDTLPTLAPTGDVALGDWAVRPGVRASLWSTARVVGWRRALACAWAGHVPRAVPHSLPTWPTAQLLCRRCLHVFGVILPGRSLDASAARVDGQDG